MNVTAEKTDEGCERASEHAPPPHMPRSSAGEQTTDANAKAAQQASGQREGSRGSESLAIANFSACWREVAESLRCPYRGRWIF